MPGQKAIIDPVALSDFPPDNIPQSRLCQSSWAAQSLVDNFFKSDEPSPMIIVQTLQVCIQQLIRPDLPIQLTELVLDPFTFQLVAFPFRFRYRPDKAECDEKHRARRVNVRPVTPVELLVFELGHGRGEVRRMSNKLQFVARRPRRVSLYRASQIPSHHQTKS